MINAMYLISGKFSFNYLLITLRLGKDKGTLYNEIEQKKIKK